MRWPHIHPCAGLLTGGSCSARIQCIGPLDHDGWCPGDGETWCEDCLAMIDAGKRCDGCGVLSEDVKAVGFFDHYCEGCQAVATEPAP